MDGTSGKKARCAVGYHRRLVASAVWRAIELALGFDNDDDDDDSLSRVSTSSTSLVTPARQQSSLPRTSLERLAQATPDVCPDGLTPTRSTPSEKPTPGDDASASTVLYLAYGSNMATSTFEGRRGIRPLSAVSVTAPALELAFDLPGLPYLEPCFANTAVRKRVPKIPDKPPRVPDLPPVPSPSPPTPAPAPPARASSHGDPVWRGGLYGVVYEVTRADYARIVASEGGGASYQDLLVPCLAIPPAISIPEKPPLPEPPRPFLAHTLWAPQLPGDDEDKGDGDDDDDDGDDDDSRLARWWKETRRRLLRLAIARPRPDPAYAQPSARYLQLLVDGAAEHDLPAAYQAWLASLAPYRITTWRQRVAQALLLVAGAPFILLMVLLMRGGSRWLGRGGGDGDGRLPLWLLVSAGLLSRALWWTYDAVLHPLFGDGERSEETDEERHCCGPASCKSAAFF